MKTIFVSSTFKDMHCERDAIQEITLPILKNEAAKYGDNVHICDLRWGINTEDLDSEEGSRKVLDVCLDEIDRCRPPMVVILGDRYGWIPSEELTESVVDRKSLDKDQLKRMMELENLRMSVTALEIAYGAMSSADKSQSTLFYFRQIESDDVPDDYSAEDDEHREKLRVLKQRIVELTGGRVKTYKVRWDGSALCGVEDFAQMLAEDIKNVLLPEWKTDLGLDDAERERNTHVSFIREKNSVFSARTHLVDGYFSELTSGKRNSLIIKAPSGSGKSMLLGNLALRLMDEGYDVIPTVCGLTPQSSNAVDVLRCNVYWLEEILSLPHTVADDLSDTATESSSLTSSCRIEQLKTRYSELCAECGARGKHVYIMLDAVDCLLADEGRDAMIFMPDPSPYVGFVMTCTPELDSCGCEYVTLPPVDKEEKKAIIDGILRTHGRELDKKVIEKMINAASSDNPLYLSLLVQRLMMMNRSDFIAIKEAGDGMASITERQLAIIGSCPDTLQEMSAALLSEAGTRINSELVAAVARYLSVSRFGLRDGDLAVLLGERWSQLDFVHFITYMSENFIRREDGRFDFSHKCIREGFLRTFDDEAAVHRDILSYLKKLPAGDMMRTHETAYHCILADDKEYFIDYIEGCEYNTPEYNAASSDVVAFSNEDGGAWVRSLFKCDKKSFRLCNFISSSFIYGTPSELGVAQSVLSANIGYAEKNAEQFSQVVVSLAYNNFAFVCASLGGNENLYTAYLYYFRSLTSIEEAQRAFPDVDLREDVALRSLNYATALVKYGGETNYNKAVHYFAEAIRLRNELYLEDGENVTRIRNLSAAYDEIGAFISEFSTGENRRNAEEYLKRSLELKKSFAGKIPDVEYRDGLINSYVYFAKLLSLKASVTDVITSKSNNEDAIEYLCSALPLIRQNYSVTRKPYYVVSEMNAYEMLGTIYGDKLGTAYDPKKSRDCHDEVIRIYRKADPGIITPRMKELYAFALNGLALSITEEREKARYGDAIAMYEEAISILEALSEKNCTPYVNLQLVTVCSNCGFLYSRTFSRDALSRGAAYCEKAERIIKELEKAGALTPDFGKREFWLYNSMLEIYTKQFKFLKCLVYAVKAIEASSRGSTFKLSEEYGEQSSDKKSRPKLKITIGVWMQRLSIAFEIVMLTLLTFFGNYEASVSAGAWSLVLCAILVYVGSIMAEKRIRLIELMLYLLGAACIWGLMNGFIHAMLT